MTETNYTTKKLMFLEKKYLFIDYCGGSCLFPRQCRFATGYNSLPLKEHNVFVAFHGRSQDATRIKTEMANQL